MAKELIGYDAEEHAEVVSTLRAETDLKLYNIFKHFDPKGLRVVDVGCGDGIISRKLIDMGSELVLGIDSHPDMVKLAIQLSEEQEDSISYKQAFIEDCKGDESYDLAILAYLLNYAQTVENLKAKCTAVASFLKPGGKVVVFNNNPFDTVGGDFSKYGFRKKLTGLSEGAPIHFDYRPIITEDIVNFYLTPEEHIEAFKAAGFSEVRWEPLILPEGDDPSFWKEYYAREHLPVICMVAIK